MDPTGTTFKTAARWRRPSLEFLTGCLTVLASATCGIAAILRLRTFLDTEIVRPCRGTQIAMRRERHNGLGSTARGAGKRLGSSLGHRNPQICRPGPPSSALMSSRNGRPAGVAR